MNPSREKENLHWRYREAALYGPAMSKGPRHFLIHSFAVCLLFFSSVFSAAAMAPTQEDAALAEVLQMGFTIDDLCVDDIGGHDHSCPFCTLLPDVASPSMPDVMLTLMPFSAWHAAEDLHRAAQARDHARSPRAPPSLI